MRSRIAGLALVWSIVLGGSLGGGWATKQVVEEVRRLVVGPYQDLAAAFGAGLAAPSVMFLGYGALAWFARPLRGDQDLWQWIVRLHFPRA